MRDAVRAEEKQRLLVSHDPIAAWVAIDSYSAIFFLASISSRRSISTCSATIFSPVIWLQLPQLAAGNPKP